MSALPVVGVLGGTFVPINLGHLEIATVARAELGLDRAVLLPAAAPPHKDPAGLSPAADREAMLRLAVADRPGLEISRLELDAGEVCYTIDSLRRLRRGPPPCRPVFLMGMDSLIDLPTWRDFRALVREFDLVVFDRTRQPLVPVLAGLPPEVAMRVVPVAAAAPANGGKVGWRPGPGGRIFHLRMQPIPISSRLIRARAAEGSSLDGLVPPAVAGYILHKKLYRQEDER